MGGEPTVRRQSRPSFLDPDLRRGDASTLCALWREKSRLLFTGAQPLSQVVPASHTLRSGVSEVRRSSTKKPSSRISLSRVR